jgi:hypothetical protein
MSIVLFDKVCLYNTLKDETIIYGQYTIKFNCVLIDDVIGEVVFKESRPDFYIKLKGKIYNLKTIVFNENTNKLIQLEDVHLHFPFEDCDLQLNSKSAIITTICKDYSHRLDEWIQYNLNLGFSGIVIFNNDGNKLNSINESLDFCTKHETTEEICKKYKGKVWVVDMPYSPFINHHWNSIQSITLYIGVNAFRNKCRHIALIDADEFIYFPNNKNMKIEDFLENYSTITMQSNILTNKNDNDLLNNNILELAKYVGENKYKKTILHTDKIIENEFIFTPHEHWSETIMNKEDIIHYHCWMNTRYNYNESMPLIDLLSI